MKSRLLVMGLVLLGLTGRQALAASSPVHFGAEVGFVGSNLIGLDALPSAYSPALNLGFTAGLFLQVDISKTFSVLVEALYIEKGGEAVDASLFKTFTLTYVEVPVLLKISLPLIDEGIKPYFFAGGAVNINLSAESVESGVASAIANLKTSDLGVIAGIGVDVERFFINLRYELGLGDISDTINVQNGALMVMVGGAFI